MKISDDNIKNKKEKHMYFIYYCMFSTYYAFAIALMIINIVMTYIGLIDGRLSVVIAFIISIVACTIKVVIDKLDVEHCNLSEPFGEEDEDYEQDICNC